MFNLTLKAIGNILVANIKSIKAYVPNTWNPKHVRNEEYFNERKIFWRVKKLQYHRPIYREIFHQGYQSSCEFSFSNSFKIVIEFLNG